MSAYFKLKKKKKKFNISIFSSEESMTYGDYL